MIIAGIEVIRGSATFLCECIKCGYFLESTEHCDGLLCPRCGSQMRRAERPGPGQPTSIEVAPPGKLELTYGETLRITTGFNYRGPATDITLYGSIGSRRGFPTYDFDEIISNEASLKTPDSQTAFVPVTASVDIPITADIDPKPDYDIYCKIKEYPKVGTPEVDDVIEITGIPLAFELLEETIYPYAYIYDGDCDVTTFTFKTDPFTPASWIAGKLAAHFENEVRKAGGRVMEMRVYVDRSPLLWTDWRIEVVGIPAATAGTAMPLGLAWWAAILVVAIAIIAVIIVATLAIKTIVGLFKRKVGLDEVKVGWGKDTLIMTIQDSEEYWERTPTPIETLEGMSEEELRHLLNQIAEEEAPPTEGLGLGLAVAAVGVLGLGALALGAYAMARPRETE